MDLYLVRHGNTFGPSDKVVRAGSSTDFELVEKGREQARAVAAYFKKEAIVPNALYAGPLLRTRESAEILKSTLELKNIEVQIDPRLNELDYGAWSGLSDEEIAERFGEDELNRWNVFSRWPRESIFGGSEEDAIREAQSFLDDMATQYAENDSCIAFSSNGKLRYFLCGIPDEFEVRRGKHELKVKTGHLCHLSFQDNKWKVMSWNVSP